MYPGERFNSYSHILGAVLSAIATLLLIAKGLASEHPKALASYTIFGLGALALYSISSLYHSTRQGARKGLFKRLDHIAIYVFIAASYTPFMLVPLAPGEGGGLLLLVWLLAAAGAASELLLSGVAIKVCQLILYLTMGWLSLLKWGPLSAALPAEALALLVNGGIAYTAGIAFYIADKLSKLPYLHGIWHLFVLAGSGCHFGAVYFYLA